MAHSMPSGRPLWAEMTPSEIIDSAHEAALLVEAYFAHSSEENNAAASSRTYWLPDQPGWAAKIAEHADDITEPDFDALYEQHLSDKAQARDAREYF